METATVTLSRSWALVGRNRKWQIMIDDDSVGSIAMHETVDMPVEPGHHHLRLKSRGTFSSVARPFDAEAGQRIAFSCRARLLWPALLAALFKHDLWISLRPD